MRKAKDGAIFVAVNRWVFNDEFIAHCVDQFQKRFGVEPEVDGNGRGD